MVQQGTAVALRKYEGVTTLTVAQAQEILTKLWPGAEEASPMEVYKAKMVCVQYRLNPLLKHLFLIPFDKKDREGNVVSTTYSMVMGIGAKRLIASRVHSYSYLDDTPRVMSEAEEVKIFGSVDPNRVRCITKLKDLTTGATAQGYGEWKKLNSYNKPNNPKGLDKGNSQVHQASIRSESDGLGRLYPVDMPGADIPVIDEAFIPGPGMLVNSVDGEVVEHKEPSGDQEPETTKSDQSGTTEPADTKKAQPDDGQAQTKPDPAAKRRPQKNRDLSKLKDHGDLKTALYNDLGVSEGQQLAELNIKAWTELAMSLPDAYRLVEAAYKTPE